MKTEVELLAVRELQRDHVSLYLTGGVDLTNRSWHITVEMAPIFFLLSNIF